MSSSSTSNIYYEELPDFHTLTLPEGDRPATPEARILIDGAKTRCEGAACTEGADLGLRKPSGLALHQGRKQVTLFVSDTEAQNVYAYEIAGGFSESRWNAWNAAMDMDATAVSVEVTQAALATDAANPGSGLKVGKQRKILEGILGVRWLAVDGEGNLFFTIEDGKVQICRAADLRTILAGGAGLATPEVLYAKDAAPSVSTPAGIASDGRHVYWANQAGGTGPGTIVSALQRPTDYETPPVPIALAANGDGAFGLCIARNNVFYTTNEKSLFATSVDGGTIAEISDGFQTPRGVAYDGEGTLFVADTLANAVYSLPAIARLRPVRRVMQVVAVPAPEQIVLFTDTGRALNGPKEGAPNSGGPRSRAGPFLGLLVALAAVIWC